MRLRAHVHGRFHARTEPWRYEDFPAQHRAERDVKVFIEYRVQRTEYRERTESRPQMRLDCLFISRKGRKGRRTSNANYAIAEVVAGYARQRAQRQRKLLALTLRQPVAGL